MSAAEAIRQEIAALDAALKGLYEANPLEAFHACEQYCGADECPEPSERNPSGGRPKQHDFMAAPHLVVASNAGNRFGKTTAMVVWSIIQHAPDHLLPERLKVFKRPRAEKALKKPVDGRYMLPSEELLEDTVLPVFRLWMPPSMLRGGEWTKAYRKAPGNTIHFADGGKLSFHTYKQDAQMLAGWSGDYVLWDEPPPESHWREGGLIRVMDRGGSHRFGMTPVNMVGGGIGWVKKQIFDKANPDKPNYNPNFLQVKASVHDNPDYSPEQIEQTLSEYPADERQAREFGDFIHFGGMIYPGGFEKVKRPKPKPEEIKRMDVIVGIDPGLKNAAFIWVAFDNENRAVVFDELLLKECTPKDYKAGLDFVNAKWGIKSPQYIIDPSARNRPTSGVGQSVEALLQNQGIYTSHGQNDVQAGVQQVRVRLAEGALHVSEECVHLCAEADEYRMEDRPDGEFKVVKENDHRLDALRYVCMERLWWTPTEPEDKVLRDYSNPPFEPPYDPYAGVTPDYGPMGPYS